MNQMKIQKYELKEAYAKMSAGSNVYELVCYDYGLANDDTRTTGIPHMSVTLKPDGGYPSFTIPEYLLKMVD